MDDDAAFFDAMAAYYDARHRSGDDDATPADARFYRDLVADADGPALELGVGTGRVYLELLAAGLVVDGVDVSTGMLDVLREKAAARGLTPSVRRGDVLDLDPDREYDVVYAPNRMFNHLTSIDDQRAALHNVRDALAPGGRFALNTFVPAFDVVADYGDAVEQTLTVDDDHYRVVATTSLDDEVEQVARLHHEVHRNGAFLTERETTLALVPKRQFELLFDAAGFSDWTAYGDFDREPLESPSQEMVWVVER
ncbi:class I SAM-dependent methyltransferase [Halorubellus litoreus]|uniref:Class I SAM-dependent methyltransferase n=1 Tax=Halorubellus litoreus TaxID=755308 RepID=A0ABD5VBK1_9EURY